MRFTTETESMWFLLNYDVWMCECVDGIERVLYACKCIGCKQKLKGNRGSMCVRVCVMLLSLEWKMTANTINDLKYDSHSRNVAHTHTVNTTENMRLRYSFRSVDEVHTILSARSIVLVLPLHHYHTKHICTTHLYTTFILNAHTVNIANASSCIATQIECAACLSFMCVMAQISKTFSQ